METTTESTKPTYRTFYTSDALKQYAKERGIPVCMAAREVLGTPSPLDTCVIGAYDPSKDTPEGRAVHKTIVAKLKW